MSFEILLGLPYKISLGIRSRIHARNSFVIPLRTSSAIPPGIPSVIFSHYSAIVGTVWRTVV